MSKGCGGENTKDQRKALLDELVFSLEEQRACGQYNKREGLRDRLREVLLADQEGLEWLSKPLIQAILQGDDSIDVLRTGPKNVQTPRCLLFWLCQWRILRSQYGWKGRDDFVLIALRLGARAEPELEGSTVGEEESVLSAAIMFGSADTVLHLIRFQKEAREYMYREMVLQDIFRKALNRACPNILKLLLRYIPVTERVWIDCYQHGTAVDYLLHRMVEDKISTERVTDEDLGQCLLQLLKQGVAYTPLTTTLLSRALYEKGQTKTAQNMVQMFFGNWMPRTARQQSLGNKLQTKQNNRSSACVICLEDPPPNHSRLPVFLRHAANPTVTLYCGHAFCDACIRQWGASQPEKFRASKTAELSCPICRKPLSREFLSDLNRVLLGKIGNRRRNTLGLDPTQHFPPGPRGPQLLSRMQIIAECQARGIQTSNYEEAVRTLAKQWNIVKRQRREGPQIMVDLGSSKTLFPHYVAPKQGPAMIPIWVNGIPILAGISGSSPYTVVTPAAAKIFQWKVRPLASNEFQQFQHRQNGDDSSSSEESDSDNEDFVVKKTSTRMQVLDEVVITLGEASKIEVRLRNAVVPSESSTPSGWRPGIVLGLDFLESAAWTQAAVEVDIAESIQRGKEDKELFDRKFMILLHGGLYIHRVTDMDFAQNMREEFRYYAFNGKTFRTELLHIQSPEEGNGKELFFSVGHARHRNTSSRSGGSKAAFTECEWCCRMFHYFGPSQHNVGMIRCFFCHGISSAMREYVFYCDSECQKLASEAHSYRHGEYWGMVATWCRVFVRVLLDLVRNQGHVFLISFLIGFSASILGKRWDQGPIQEMWAQHTLLLPRVE